MTNKEVIYFLDEVRKIILDDKSWLESTTQPINEAFDMAISALEQSELCNDDKGCSNCMYSGRPTYKSPCSECRDNSQWEMKPISRSHENGTECEDTISRQAAIDALDQIFDRCEEIEAHLPEGDPDRTGYKMYPDYMTVWKYLHQLSSAQLDIIHCRECKNCQIDSVFHDYWCDGRKVWKDHYCGYAERRTDEQVN